LANGSNLISPVSRVSLRLATDEHLVALVRHRGGRVGTAAFEVLYERHVRGLLAFSIYMLGSRDDAEDAVQAAFAAAHRSLLSRRREVAVRPWLFTITRNECINILRKRRPTVELNGEPAMTGDPVRSLALREEVQGVVEDVRRLPERQRAALVLAEVDGLSQAEIGGILGVRADQVKAYMYQARTNLIAERGAREADCAEIREQLASSHGPALRRSRIRRHTRSCDGCRAYAESVRSQRRQLTALLPVTPTLGLKYRILEQLFGVGVTDPTSYAESAAIGSAITGAIAELAGGGMKALAAKLAAGVIAIGATAEVGMSVLKATNASHGSLGASGESAQVGASPTTNKTLAAASLAPKAAPAIEHNIRFSPARSAAQPGSAASPGTNDEAQTPGLEPAARPIVGSSEGQVPPSPSGPAPADQHSGTGSQTPSAEAWSAAPTKPPHDEEHARHRRERELARGERERAREERKARHEHGSDEQPSEEVPEVGMSGAPKRTPQERQELHEEHERRREERKTEREERHGSGG